jgi:hypothetical protein
MSAQLMFDTAPLGALIRFSDSRPKPPPRFTKKLAAWVQKNGVGRLVRKEAAIRRGNHTTAASITLHHGNFASGGIVVVIAYMTYAVSSALTFEIVEHPPAGSVRVLQPFGETMELLHLAADFAQAEAWLRANSYRGAILEPVNAEDNPAALHSVQTPA